MNDKMRMCSLLSIIIPVFNSEKTIEEVVNRIKLTLEDKQKFEVILVNDGSIDSSYDKCKQLSKLNNFIKLINLSKNFGQHSAILAGLQFAKGEYIAVLDDDLQTPPDEIWKLIDKIKEGYDVVYANYIYKKHNFLQNIGSKINYIMATILLKKPKTVKTSSYFIIRKYLAKEIINYSGPYPYLAGLILRVTNNIGVVNISHKERLYGKSNYSFLKMVELWINGFTNFSVKPLRVALLLGILFAVAGFLLSILLLIRNFINLMVVVGWTSIIVIILFSSGIQLILIGLIGEYVGRIFMSQNRQPQYIIKEKYNIKDNSE